MPSMVSIGGLGERQVWRWTRWHTHFCHDQKTCGTERVKPCSPTP